MMHQCWRPVRVMALLAACLALASGVLAQDDAGTTAAGNPARTPVPSDGPGLAFSRQWLESRAAALANSAYAPRSMAADNPLRALDYDQYRRIVFNPAAAIWRSESVPYQLQLFHPGWLHTEPVDIFLMDNGLARRLPFATSVFDYHPSLDPVAAEDAGGYAGFRIHTPINTPARYEEFLVFLGASYFRAVGRNQFYGLSARGLAVNTVGSGGEEFPRFTAFWIEKPAPESQQIRVHALLDSRSVTGAYHFLVKPGDTTRLDVEATLFPRQELTRFGIAPLTSMFLFDSTNRDRYDDFRHAVHDSDGLFIVQANGERVWRPLANPVQLQVSAFGSSTPAGFGLLQRHQDFGDFNDAEARYDKRTSLWIEPLEDWGAGHVELVEIPTGEEINDNIVAYWQPAEALQAGNSYRFRYRMHWGQESPGLQRQGRVVDTATGAVDGSDERVFVIDYSGGELIQDVTSDPDAMAITATTSAGRITDVSGTLVEATGHYRVYIKLEPGDTELAELRVTLNVGGRPWGETWLYRWTR